MPLADTFKDLRSELSSFAEEDIEDVPTPGADSRLTKLKGSERARKAYELKMRGMRVVEIATLFGVSDSAIYQLLRRHFEGAAQEMSSQAPINAIVEHLEFCENVARIALFEANNINSTVKRVDPRTGSIVEEQAKGEMKDKNLLLKTALAAQASKMEILVRSGIISSDGARQFSVVRPEEKKEVGKEVSLDELKNSLLELLRTTKSV